MDFEQREALDEIIVKIRSGRLTRRSFLERALAVGLTSSAAVSLLEACGGTSGGSGGNGNGVTNLIWQSENEATNTYSQLVDTFNNGTGKQKGVHVTWRNGPSGPTSSGDLLARYQNMLRARKANIDVMSIDIIYPAQFASQGWTTPITDSQWPSSDRQNYLPGPLQGCTYQGKVVAAPLRTDLGLLYYRTDITKTPPKTWNDLKSMAQQDASKAKYGYVWQGAQYEGLVCDFVEVLHGYGGSVLDTNNPTKVTVNSPEAQQALTDMVSWVGTISPDAVTTYAEDQTLAGFVTNGDAIFMRNWPYAVSIGNTPSKSKVAGKFDFTSLPYGGSSTTGHSAIGGWNLAINAYSKNTDAAWTFIQYMLQSDAQKLIATQASLTGSLKSLYTDSQVTSKQPLFAKLGPILQNALPRPVSAQYSEVSNAIQRRIYSALKKQASPADALSGLATDLSGIVKA